VSAWRARSKVKTRPISRREPGAAANWSSSPMPKPAPKRNSSRPNSKRTASPPPSSTRLMPRNPPGANRRPRTGGRPPAAASRPRCERPTSKRARSRESASRARCTDRSSSIRAARSYAAPSSGMISAPAPSATRSPARPGDAARCCAWFPTPPSPDSPRRKSSGSENTSRASTIAPRKSFSPRIMSATA